MNLLRSILKGLFFLLLFSLLALVYVGLQGEVLV